MDWDIVGYVKRSKYRKKVLFLIKENHKTQKELRDETGYYLSHIATTLKELIEKKLVVCLNPSLYQGKIYSITDLGLQIINEIIKNEKII